MVTLKWGCRGAMDVLGIKSVQGGAWYKRGEKGRHATWDNTYQWSFACPPDYNYNNYLLMFLDTELFELVELYLGEGLQMTGHFVDT